MNSNFGNRLTDSLWANKIMFDVAVTELPVRRSENVSAQAAVVLEFNRIEKCIVSWWNGTPVCTAGASFDVSLMLESKSWCLTLTVELEARSAPLTRIWVAVDWRALRRKNVFRQRFKIQEWIKKRVKKVEVRVGKYIVLKQSFLFPSAKTNYATEKEACRRGNQQTKDPQGVCFFYTRRKLSGVGPFQPKTKRQLCLCKRYMEILLNVCSEMSGRLSENRWSRSPLNDH